MGHKNKTFMRHIAFYRLVVAKIQNELDMHIPYFWGSIFQGCHGHGKVRGEQIIFKVGKK